MILILEEPSATVELQEQVITVYEIADFSVPSGINESLFTAEGQLICSLAGNTPAAIDNPDADGLVLTSNPSVPGKVEWRGAAAGGGGGLLNNKSGSAVEVGAVLIPHASYDYAFNTTTTASDPAVIGVAAEAISANADGRVISLGRNTVLVQGNVARGDWLVASTTAGRASSAGTTRPANAIGLALEAYTGGGAGSVSAWVDALTIKRITPRVGSATSSATPTINTDSYDAYKITALATAITSMTTNLSGTPTDFQKLLIRIKDDGTARAITWGASFQSGSITLPATTLAGKVLMVGLIWDSVDSKWTCEASGSRA